MCRVKHSRIVAMHPVYLFLIDTRIFTFPNCLILAEIITQHSVKIHLGKVKGCVTPRKQQLFNYNNITAKFIQRT